MNDETSELNDREDIRLLSDEVARPKRHIEPEVSQRLAALRHDAPAELEQLLNRVSAAGDPLGAVAWIGSMLGEDHERTSQAIDAAKEARFQWNEIADALGIDSDDERAVQALSLRWRRRRP